VGGTGHKSKLKSGIGLRKQVLKMETTTVSLSWRNIREFFLGLDCCRDSFSETDASAYNVAVTVKYSQDKKPSLRQIDFSKAFNKDTHTLNPVEFDNFIKNQLKIKDIKQIKQVLLTSRPEAIFYKRLDGKWTNNPKKADPDHSDEVHAVPKAFNINVS
jgi:hypothetical protein